MLDRLLVERTKIMSRMIELQAERALYAPAVDVAEAAPPRLGDLSDEEKAKLRRQMYERIARGHALAEAENAARRKWRGR
jgi:hypothetical protein